MESILESVKKYLGIEPTYTHFDGDLILDINSVFPILYQLGVGPEGFEISDANESWTEYLGDAAYKSLVRTYVCLKTKLLFDPPSNSFLVEAIKDQIKEIEWRLNVYVDPSEQDS